jgi:glycosyltransferase involved in cell wall biosynthesis
MKISVVVPTYNNIPYISEALNSLVNQTHEPYEIIVTDDNSTDVTPSVIRDYADTYPDLIRPMLHDQNVGISANYNRAFQTVRGDLVTWLPGDDRYRARKLEQELAAFRDNQEADIAFSNFCYTKPDGTQTRVWTDHGTPPTGDVLSETLQRDWPDGNLFRCPLVSYDLLESVGFFDEQMYVYPDWDLKIALSIESRVTFAPEIGPTYRIHPGGHSQTTSAKKYLEDTKRIREKYDDVIAELPADERDRVIKSFEGYELLYESRYALERGERFQANRKYVRYLSRNPTKLLQYKAHVKYVLPDPAYKIVRRAYRSVAQ